MVRAQLVSLMPSFASFAVSFVYKSGNNMVCSGTFIESSLLNSFKPKYFLLLDKTALFPVLPQVVSIVCSSSHVTAEMISSQG